MKFQGLSGSTSTSLICCHRFLCTYQFKAGGGGGRAWGGDLIVIVGPGVGLLTDLAFPGEGIFESVFAQSGDSEYRLE